MPVQSVQVDAKTSEIMDTLRGVSALVVACVHTFQIFLIPYFGLGSPSHVITGMLATHAVTTFFVASGFMICVSVARHRNEDGTFRSGAFAEARILRIYPPLIAAMLLTIAVYFAIIGFGLHGAESYRLGGEVDVVRERATFEWNLLPSTFFLLYGTFANAPAPINMDGPLWTLGFEWWFYVLAFVSARLWNGLTLSTIMPFAAGVWIVLTNHDVFFIWFLVIWLGGFTLGAAYLSGVLFRLSWRAVALLALAVIATALIVGRRYLITDLLDPFGSLHGKRIWACVGLLIAVGIASAIRMRRDWRMPSWITGLAAFSYTLYVVHYPLLLLAYSLLHPLTHGHGWLFATLVAAAAVVPIVGVAALLARVVENRRAIRRVISKVLGRAQAVDANLRVDTIAKS
jgi:peptidoglycan/LPS O-acetylase OafA/YrhL